jgi:hypothetical protein
LINFLLIFGQYQPILGIRLSIADLSVVKSQCGGAVVEKWIEDAFGVYLFRFSKAFEPVLSALAIVDSIDPVIVLLAKQFNHYFFQQLLSDFAFQVELYYLEDIIELVGLVILDDSIE